MLSKNNFSCHRMADLGMVCIEAGPCHWAWGVRLVFLYQAGAQWQQPFASTALPSPKAITKPPSLCQREEQESRSCCSATSRAAPHQGCAHPLLDPANCHKSFPLPASERQLLNFKYSKTQLAFPIKLPFYGIV